jgi:archaellin
MDALHEPHPFDAIYGSRIDAVEVVTRTKDTATVKVALHEQNQHINGKAIRGKSQKYTLHLRRETFPVAPIFGAPTTIWRVVPPTIDDVVAKPLNQTPRLNSWQR